jgi:hypothetical protein
MALALPCRNRAILPFLVALCALLLHACAPKAAEPAHFAEAPLQFKDVPRRPGLPAVLVFLRASPSTLEAWGSLRDELHESYDVVTRPISPSWTSADVQRELRATKPTCVVLMGNQALNLYRDYQGEIPGPYPPAVVLMASFLEQQLGLVGNATGIAYEVPGVTTFVKLRSFVYRPVQRVGVIYRPLFQTYLRKQRELGRSEQIAFVEREVSEEPGVYEIRAALTELIKTEKVDTIWVLNDNALLTPELIGKGWLKVLHKHPTNVVVGVSNFVDSRLHFGSFAMLPDHAGLGVQAANLIYKLADEGWQASSTPVELPLSVQSVIDLPWTRQHFQFRVDALDRIDRIVQ